MPINPMLLQDSKSAPLQYVKDYYSAKHMQQTCSLHEDTTTFIAMFLCLEVYG